MASTFSSNKRLELPGYNDYIDTWNVPVNADMTAIDVALGGSTLLNATSPTGTVTLTYTQYRPLSIIVSGAMSADVFYTIPAGVGGQWTVTNGTTGPYSVYMTSAAGGASVRIPQGYSTVVSCDGSATGMRLSVNTPVSAAGANTQVQYNSSGSFAGSSNLTFNGTTLTAAALTVSGALSAGSTSGGAITGTSFSSSGSITASGSISGGSISGSSISGGSISGSSLSVGGGSISGGSLNVGSGAITTGSINASNEIRGASLVTTSGAVYLNSGLSAFMSWDGTNILLNQPLYNPNNIVSGSGYLSAGIINYNYSYTGNSVQLAPNQTSSVFSKADTGATNQIVFNNGNGQVGFINTNGSSTAYGTASDHRLKTNVNPMVDALKTISALKPCTYEWKVSGLGGEGFIAHELHEVIPHAVMGEKDAVNEDGSIKPQGVDYSKIVVHLVAAIQELTAKIEALEARG
jgi:hypothetical protein